MDDDDWPDDHPPYRDGKVHVLSARCSTCVFRPGNLMHLSPGRMKDLVETNRRNDTAFACHQTLGGEQAICFGYFDAYHRDITPLRFAVALGVIEWVDPPNERK